MWMEAQEVWEAKVGPGWRGLGDGLGQKSERTLGVEESEKSKGENSLARAAGVFLTFLKCLREK